MPRSRSGSGKPSAAGRFLTNKGSNNPDKQILPEDCCGIAEMWSLLQDAITAGVAITVGRTLDGRSITIAFYADGDRSTWYIQSHEDWQEMIQTIAL